MKNRLDILDIWVDPVTRQEALDRVWSFLQHGDRPHSIFASNPEKNFSVPKDQELYKAYQDADLLLPDGIGIVVATRILYGLKLARVPGSEFIFDICQLAVDHGRKVFVYGAKEAVNKAAVDILMQRYPGLNISGRSNGYVKEADMPDLISRINDSRAEILFIALGSPKQEKWFASHKGSLKYARVCQGVGGTLDTIVGTVKRAPESWLRLNLEWLYRLIAEPSRIRRQKVLPLFAAMVLVARLKQVLRSF